MVSRLVEWARRLALAIGGVLVALDVIRSAGRSDADTPAEGDSARSWVANGLKVWMLRAAVLLALAAVGGALVVVSGLVPIKASSGHWPITAWFLKFVMQRSVATHTLGLSAPPLDHPRLVAKGASHYDIGCRPCHGSPGSRHPRIAQRMTPHPPDLQATAPRYSSEELFYIVKHGVKFTGMPAWPAEGRDDEVWAMVAFLRDLPGLDAAAYLDLVTGRQHTPDGVVPIQAIDPPSAPRTIIENCGRCHGMDGLGRGLGAFPKLQGQRPDYLYASMQAYARGERHSGIMGPIAAGLTSGEIQEVTRYYAALQPRAPSRANADVLQAAIERGRNIATNGIPAQLVPPCTKCHGPGGQPKNPHYPTLAGQYVEYLVLQLTLLKEGRRGGTAYQHIMRKIAGRLSDNQMRDAASYFASLPTDPVKAQ